MSSYRPWGKRNHGVLRRLSILVFSVFLLMGCNRNVPPAQPNTPVRTPAEVSPESTVSPLVAVSVLPTPTPVPTIDLAAIQVTPDRGALVGVLLVRGTSGEMRPVANTKLALGEILTDEDGNERIVGYDPAAAPSTITDENGAFVLEDVPPGRYGLVLDIVMSSFLLFDEGSGDPLFVEVTAGEITDVGVLEYEALPIPPQP